MNEIEKRICELRHQYSMIQMADSLSSEDYAKLREIDSEIEKLKSQRKGGYYVVLEGSNCFPYLTDDSNLCWSDEKTYFSTREEAQKAIRNADIHEEDRRNLKIVKEEF